VTRPNVAVTPRLWSAHELSLEAQRSLEDFRRRRLAEPTLRYAQLLRQEKTAVRRLIRVLTPVNPDNPDPAALAAIIDNPDLFDALRYVAGPPVSTDDLGVLVTASTTRLTKGRLRKDPDLAHQTLSLICQLTDGNRFPWVKPRRKATFSEVKRAVYATASLHASQRIQTERRAYGRVVEGMLAAALLDAKFTKLSPGNGNKVDAPNQLPKPKTFFGECTLRGRKTDLLIGLSDGRAVAVEAKDSASVVNSVKRVLNDTAAKAKHWAGKFGETVVPVALLSGVFGVDNLQTAQDSGLYLVWSHDLEGFLSWVEAS
jgi:hypothetical protein